jgi:hypothetical protein
MALPTNPSNPAARAPLAFAKMGLATTSVTTVRRARRGAGGDL